MTRGDELRSAREAAGVSLASVAKAIGRSVSYVAMAEYGEDVLTEDEFKLALRLLKMGALPRKRVGRRANPDAHGIRTSVAHSVKAARESLFLSIKDAAKHIGIPACRLRHIEQADSRASLVAARRALRALEVLMKSESVAPSDRACELFRQFEDQCFEHGYPITVGQMEFVLWTIRRALGEVPDDAPVEKMKWRNVPPPQAGDV